MAEMGCTRAARDLRGAGTDHRTLPVTNNDGNDWSGTATVGDVDLRLVQCRDIMTGDTVAFERKDADAAARLTVPAYGVRVVRWER